MKKYTQEGYQKLIDELEVLKTVKRNEIKDALKAARDLGDLSENSEYDEARTQQGLNEARIAELEELIKHAIIVSEDEISKDIVSIGSTVVVKYVQLRLGRIDILGIGIFYNSTVATCEARNAHQKRQRRT